MIKLFKNKKEVSLLNEKWEIIEPRVKVVQIPRQDEYIYFGGCYYIVLNVVHNILEKHGIFIILEKIDEDLKKSS